MYFRRARKAAALVASLLAAPALALAGPPFLTDDPQPTDTGHWEIYNFVSGARGPDGLGGEAGFDLNYGGAKDLQLTAVLPLDFDDPADAGIGGTRLGPADIELAAKYKLLHQLKDGWTPDVSVFPRVFVPTASRRLDTGRPRLLLPVWAEKDVGAWSVFGGGGYEINPGPGQRDFWQGGVTLSRSFGERTFAGVEVFGQTRDASDGGGFTTLDVGGGLRLTRHWSLLSSAGPAWLRTAGRDRTGSVFYAALKADY